MPEDTFPRAQTRADIIRWLAGNSDLNPETVVTMTDEVVVAITNRQDGRGVDRSTRLTLREEVINPDAAAAWGGRSIELDLDLDCARHRVILGARRLYARPNLQGSVRITRSSDAWAEVPPDTVIDDVAHVACAPRAPAQLAAAPATPPAQKPATVAAAAAAPPIETATTETPAAADAPAAQPVRIAAADAAPSSQASDPATAPAPPSVPSLAVAAEASPSSQADDASAAPAAAPVKVAEADPAPAPQSADTAAIAPAPGQPAQLAVAEPPQTSSAASATVAAPPSDGVVVVEAAPATSSEPSPQPSIQPVLVHNPFVVAEAQGPAAQPDPQPPAPQPAEPAVHAAPPIRPPEFAVQIAAAASADLARDSWQSLKNKLPSLVAQRTFAVEPVEAKGRTLYRALLLGFSSPGEAAGLCKELRSQSVDCILRQMR